PPLRDHPGDIPEIAEYAVDDLEEEELTETALEMLERHPWPGNVRQLIKVLKRMAYLEISLTEALSHEECLTVKEPPNGGEAESFLPETRDDIRSMDWVKSAYAARALETNDNNKSDTARRLDISPNTLKAYLEIGEKDEPAENSA
ncbi:MAG: helix-turn-helix domain-containing protein, partial [Planctomycetota bacterium]